MRNSPRSPRARRGAIYLSLALSLLGCREDTLGGVEVGFRVDGRTVDFGRALVGTQVVRSVTLQSTGKSPLTVATSAGAPFSVGEEVSLPGGGQAEVRVTFTAGEGRSEGALLLSANDKSVSVPLSGEGVKPLDCVPSAPCRVAAFDLESSSCVESVAADGAACTPTSECLENGVCQGGACVGSPRGCDDQNKCTADACAPGVGCVNAPVVCPRPTRPCRVASCDPQAGCGEAFAADGTPCGSVDCVSGHFCLLGECRAVPTPEGFLCAPKTPCQGEGRCKSQRCVRPDAGVMTPEYAVPLPLPPTEGPPGERGLVAHAGNLFFELCGKEEDAGCELHSYTGSGFMRFIVPHGDRRPRRVATASDGGVIVLASDGLEAYALTNGSPLWSAPFSLLTPPTEAPSATAACGRSRVGLSSTGELLASLSWHEARDGGADAGPSLVADVQTLLRLFPDGGVAGEELVRGHAEGGLLAIDEEARVFLYHPGGALAVASWDGGAHGLQSWPSDAGVASLVVASGRLLAGARHLHELDGGASAEVAWPEADGGARLLEGPVLLGRGRGYGFYRRCAPASPPPCAADEELTMLRAFDLADGRTLWEAQVLPEGAEGELEEAALVGLGPGGVVTLTQALLGGQVQAHVELFAEGSRLFVCPLPEGGTLGGAVFDRGFLYALVRRGGAWRLEAYDLAGLPLEAAGWPQRHGVAGARRPR